MANDFVVTITEKTRDEFNDARRWCYDKWGDPGINVNAKKIWWPSCSSLAGDKYSGTFLFANKEDAILFTLIWK